MSTVGIGPITDPIRATGQPPRRRIVERRSDPQSHGATVQGTASIEHDPNGMLIDDLSHKYTGGPYPGFAGPNPQRVTVRIAAQKVTTSWPD